MAIMKKTKEKKFIPLKKEELIELIFLDLINGESRYRIMLKLNRDAYPGHKTSKLSRTSKYNYIQEAKLNCEPELKETRDNQRKLLYQQIRQAALRNVLRGLYREAVGTRSEGHLR